MKKLLLSVTIAFSVASLISQNIDNTLGNDGSFNINKSDATNMFKIVTSDTDDHILRLPNNQSVSFQIKIQLGLRCCHLATI